MADIDVGLMRGTLDLLILKALTWGPRHGYGVVEWIEQATDAALLVGEGTLYPALHRLEAQGWIEAEWGLSENNRHAKFYKLSRAGRAQLASGTLVVAAVRRGGERAHCRHRLAAHGVTDRGAWTGLPHRRRRAARRARRRRRSSSSISPCARRSSSRAASPPDAARATSARAVRRPARRVATNASPSTSNGSAPCVAPIRSEQPSTGHRATRCARCAQQHRLHRRRAAHPRTRHRREHVDLHARRRALLRTLPVPHPEQLVTIGDPARTGGLSAWHAAQRHRVVSAVHRRARSDRSRSRASTRTVARARSICSRRARRRSQSIRMAASSRRTISPCSRCPPPSAARSRPTRTRCRAAPRPS